MSGKGAGGHTATVPGEEELAVDKQAFTSQWADSVPVAGRSRTSWGPRSMYHIKTMRVGVFALLATLATAILAGCARRHPASGPGLPPSGAQQGVLRVWLPCGLADWVGKFDDIIGPAAGGPKLEYETVNSWGLAERLKGADPKPDLIIMPGDRELAALDATGLLDSKPTAWAMNRIAVLTPKANPARIEQLADLAKASAVVVAPEDTSQGYYARETLKKAGLLEKLQGRLVSPKTPAEVYRLLADGEAEVGLSYAGCSLPPVQEGPCCPPVEATSKEASKTGERTGPAVPKEKLAKVMVLGPVPEEYCPLFPATAAIVKGAPHRQAAEWAIKQLVSETAQEKIADWMPAPAVTTAKTVGRVELHMYCGAGIRPPVEKLAHLFEQRNPNIKLNIAYAGSGCLLAQLTFARRGDLYMPGEDYYLNLAQERGFLIERKHIAYFVPVILVAKGNPKKIKGLKDLLRTDLKVATGEPKACAVGKVTKEMLERMGIWDEFERLSTRRSLNVPELGYWVSIGAVDAAVVWMAQARQFEKYCDYVPIPPEAYGPVDISIALLKFTVHPEEAKAFIDLLASPEGQKVFEEQGYSLTPKPVTAPSR